MMTVLFRTLLIALAAGIGPALAQGPGTDGGRAASTIDTTPPGTLNPQPLPPLAHPDAKDTPAKELFARKLTPYPGPPRAIGGYADGCMEGAEQLPITGPTWQVMRLSRDRNWGNPELIKFIERLGANAKKAGWNGLLIGRHGAAARRPGDFRPCQPSDRSRCRYLADADAQPRAVARRNARWTAPSTWLKPNRTGS